VTSDYFDVVIVGAGLSGVGAACHLQDKSPGKSYAILESRAATGGTWDLFRYPGIRSDTNERVVVRANMLLMCSGYYNYEHGYLPEFNGRERFAGNIVHPQHWPEDLDYRDKKVVVIGSGATAMTLIPKMAEDVAHVVMLQRSPTYVISFPYKDLIANVLRWILPGKWAYAITRWKNINFQQWMYGQTRKRPETVKRYLLRQVRKELGKEYDVERHFSPAYNPWDQRLCLVPNSDLFAAIRSGKASVATDQIDTFTENGILLTSGDELEAGIIGFSSGYIQRVLERLPKQGDREPWTNPQDYSRDRVMFREGNLEDGALVFDNPSRRKQCA